jgi:hypothetical protein
MFSYCAFALFLAAGGAPPPRIPVVYVPLVYAQSELYRDVSRPFERSKLCAGRTMESVTTDRRRPASIREILGGDATLIRVHYYEKPRWKNMALVTDYIDRILDAAPEAGLIPGPMWSEGKVVEIIAEVEFASGKRSRFDLANGYVHIEDASGCAWYGRYLGGDRTKWTVRKGTTDGWR